MQQRKRQAKQTVHRDRAPVDAADLRWPKIDDDVARTLPPVLRGVVKALGWGRARDFLEAHGGRCIYLPALKTAALGLSPDELQRLRITLEPHLMDGYYVALPMPDKLFQRWRDEDFAKEMHRLSIPQLAKKYQITERWVLMLKRRCEGIDERPGTAPGQMSIDF